MERWFFWGGKNDQKSEWLKSESKTKNSGKVRRCKMKSWRNWICLENLPNNLILLKLKRVSPEDKVNEWTSRKMVNESKQTLAKTTMLLLQLLKNGFCRGAIKGEISTKKFTVGVRFLLNPHRGLTFPKKV